jgi:hypothetical protein
MDVGAWGEGVDLIEEWCCKGMGRGSGVWGWGTGGGGGVVGGACWEGGVVGRRRAFWLVLVGEVDMECRTPLLCVHVPSSFLLSWLCFLSYIRRNCLFTALVHKGSFPDKQSVQPSRKGR